MAWITGTANGTVIPALLCLALVITAGCSFSEDLLSEGLCDRMSGLDRDHCFQQLAKDQGSSEYCAKIENAGPKSKCYIYLDDCSRLNLLATGDGAYTRYDCYQYLAVQYHSVDYCRERLKDYTSGNRNDLNPTGISMDTCIQRATEYCGHIGQISCYDVFYNKAYCVTGKESQGNCVAETGT